jgi:hypothetical protein
MDIEAVQKGSHLAASGIVTAGQLLKEIELEEDGIQNCLVSYIKILSYWFRISRSITSTKVSSKFGVYRFLVFSEFQARIACFFSFNIISRLSIAQGLYLYTRK